MPRYEIRSQNGFGVHRQKKRDHHLKRPDFFNAKEFPVLKLESTSSKKKGMFLGFRFQYGWSAEQGYIHVDALTALGMAQRV
jgi:hypothetical protein